MSAINLSTLESAIYDWVVAVTGNAAIYAFENAPQPNAALFFILNIGAIDQIGQDFVSNELDGSGNFDIIGNREFTTNIQGKGSGSIDKLEDLRSSLEKPSILSTLRAANIAIVNALNIINLTGLDDTVFVQRGSLDIIMRTHSEIIDNVGYFNKTNITGNFNDAAGNTVITQEIPIDVS